MARSGELCKHFVVRIGPGADGLRVRVDSSPAGEGKGAPFRVPFGERELERLERRFAETGLTGRSDGAEPKRHLRPIAPPDDERWAEAAGERLFHALLPGPLGELWKKSVWHVESGARHPRARLLLRLCFDLDDSPVGLRLHRLPWELLYDPDADGGGFLALDDRLAVARYLEIPRPPRHGPAPDAPIVLVAAAAPRGPRAPVPLDLERELDDLRRALHRDFRVRVLEHATLPRLRQALREETVHVLHFMGHGDLDEATGEGALVLEHEEGGTPDGTPDEEGGTPEEEGGALVGRPSVVGARRLVEEIGDALPGVRLVVLNACRTAEAAAGAPYAGVATALVAGGAGAVVAMQHPIADGAAIAFARALYRQVAAGAAADEAVREGRRAIRTQDPTSAQWAIPALFLRTPAEPLFPRRSKRRLATVALTLLLATTAATGTWWLTRGDRTLTTPRATIHRIPLGEPTHVPEIGGAVLAERTGFPDPAMTLLSASLDDGSSARRAVYPGETLQVTAENGDVVEIHLMTVDTAEGTATVRTSRE